MKIKPNSNLAVNVVLIVVLVFIIGQKISPYIKSINRHNTYNAWESVVKPIDAGISENLPYNQYVKLQDSINTIRELKNGIVNVSQFFPGDMRDSIKISMIMQVLKTEHTFGKVNTSLITLAVISNIVSCDTCNLQWIKENILNKKTPKPSYIELLGWKIDDSNDLGYFEEGKFHVERGQGYVRTAVLDSSAKRGDGSVYHQITIRDIPVKFRYDNLYKCIMIPIKDTTASILNIVFRSFWILRIVYTYLLIIVFLQFIIALSKGNSFTDKNLLRLKLIAVSLLVYPVLLFLITYLFRLIFHSYFVPGANIVLNTDKWEDVWKYLLAGFIFLLLYKAFRQGKSLQEEQDLTV